MAIALHANWTLGSYEKDRDEEIKRSENDDLRNLKSKWFKNIEARWPTIGPTCSAQAWVPPWSTVTAPKRGM